MNRRQLLVGVMAVPIVASVPTDYISVDELHEPRLTKFFNRVWSEMEALASGERWHGGSTFGLGHNENFMSFSWYRQYGFANPYIDGPVGTVKLQMRYRRQLVASVTAHSSLVLHDKVGPWLINEMETFLGGLV